ncbi:MAG: cobaltochelatase subunit CobN [Proteobacteria bacterium]|nr:cobaltochelatase subunit CobN [Pseudomonadota bacterium]
MHVLFREKHGLDAAEIPVDLGQSPADLAVLSFSDSDLGAFAAGWRLSGGRLPSLRLANLASLKHPLSVDTYLDQTLAYAKAILIRVIGGESYWAYGLGEVHALARRNGIALAVLPADGRDDLRLDALSTLPVPLLRQLTRLCESGGAEAARAALGLLAQAGGLASPPLPDPPALPDFGWYDPPEGSATATLQASGRPLAVAVFYRAYLAAGDTAPIDALIEALRERGFHARGLFAPSLKMPEAARWIAAELAAFPPAAIVNATAFSAKDAAGISPLDGPGCPVFQIALATNARADWLEAERGLSPADLAMHVVLPEVDGRIFAGVASFKSALERDADLEFSPFRHQPEAARIMAIAERVANWHRLARLRDEEKRFAFVLSTYPGKAYQHAHAVGLDVFASLESVFEDLGGARLPANLPECLERETIPWPLAAYRAALENLPQALREDLRASWGTPETDPLVEDGCFHFSAIRIGHHLVALQPERARREDRVADYHDTARVPCHGYVAFYLMLQTHGFHALVHMGAHGTLEWLPGKAVALSDACWPEALTGAMPVIYPFIVNDPGEAAQAKRRIGAVTLGHLPPPPAASSVPDDLVRLEQLLDEYSTADGLDPARRDRLIGAIREEARARGVEADLALDEAANAAEALTRIDRFVCDIKESRFGDGLHVFGQGESGATERAGLLAALAGRRIDAGPSGSPWRGRKDVLPTGRNLFAIDPRAVPSRAAHAQGVKLAEELLRRHLQDHGDWPKGLVVDLWGSATMRNAGEDFAMALHLCGLAPLWDKGSERVSGFEILPLAMLDRPRIDVTLRLSGLFRDVFPELGRLFAAATEALAARDFEGGDNPYLRQAPRVFGPEPGQYGIGMGDLAETFTEDARQAAGEAWLAASEWATGRDGRQFKARAALEAQLANTDAYVHAQDLPESDLLLAADYAAHHGGFAAAMARLGTSAPSLYHLDTTIAGKPRARQLNEELARILRARVANPRWADGMMRHGFRGAAEIAATLDHLAAFQQLTRTVPHHLFDLYHEAILGRGEVVAFLEAANPAALAAIRARFTALAQAGLWITRRNSIRAGMGDEP